MIVQLLMICLVPSGDGQKPCPEFPMLRLCEASSHATMFCVKWPHQVTLIHRIHVLNYRCCSAILGKHSSPKVVILLGVMAKLMSNVLIPFDIHLRSCFIVGWTRAHPILRRWSKDPHSNVSRCHVARHNHGPAKNPP